MARIRTIKPELPQDETLGHCSRDARLLFVFLFTVSDDYGCFRANAALLKGTLFAYDEGLSVPTVDGWLEELEKAELVELYVVKGQRYGMLKGWSTHQRIDNAGHSDIPDPSGNRRTSPKTSKVRGGSRRDSANVSESRLDMDMDMDMEEDKEGTLPPAASEPVKTGLVEAGEIETVIQKVWAYYMDKLKRDPLRYTLSPERKKKAKLRLMELVEQHGDINEAGKLMCVAIRNLASSDYHVTGGYIDWTDHLFKSHDRFQKTLNLKAGTANGKVQSTHFNRDTERKQSNREALLASLREEGLHQGADLGSGVGPEDHSPAGDADVLRRPITGPLEGELLVRVDGRGEIPRDFTHAADAWNDPTLRRTI